MNIRPSIVIFILLAHPPIYAQKDATSVRESFRSGIDSIKPHSFQPIQSQINQEIDSLNAKHVIGEINQSIDSARSRLTGKLDSLTYLQLKDSALNKTISDLRSSIDSLKSIGPMDDLKQAQQKLNTLQATANEKIGALEKKVNERLGLFNKNGGNAGQLNLPVVGGKGGLNLNLPGADIKVLQGPVSLEGLSPELKDLKLDSKLPGLENAKIDNLVKPDLEFPGKEELTKVTDQLGKAKEISGQVSGYQEDLENIRNGNFEKMEEVPKALEAKAAGLDEVKVFQEAVAPVNDYTEMIKKWNADPEVAKELALNKAKEQAVNHFAGHGEELKAAMEQLSKLKAKRPDADAVLDLFAKHKNSLKGKPFIERLLPGLAIQLQ